jgi:prepilin-type N-terminal cleavage/methylation domain-containing protein
MNKKAFTLVEMAIVLVIIGILAGLTISNLGGFGKKGRDQRRLADLLRLSADLIAYYNTNGNFPEPASGTSKAIPTDKEPFSKYKDPLSGFNYFYNTSTNVNVAYLGGCFEDYTSTSLAAQNKDIVDCNTPFSATSSMSCPSGSNEICIRVTP